MSARISECLRIQHDLLVDTVDEVELDALLRQAIHDTRNLFLVKVRLLPAFIVDHFNHTLVDETAVESSVNHFCVAGSTHVDLSVPLELAGGKSRNVHLSKLVVNV